MLKDFVIADAVAIQIGSQYIDLHNFYDFVQLRLSPMDGTVEMFFRRVSGLEAPADHPLTVELLFSDVDYLAVSSEVGKQSERSVHEIGYKEPNDTDLDWLDDEKHATPAAHLFVGLDNDQFVRIHARRVQARLAGWQRT